MQKKGYRDAKRPLQSFRPPDRQSKKGKTTRKSNQVRRSLYPLLSFLLPLLLVGCCTTKSSCLFMVPSLPPPPAPAIVILRRIRYCYVVSCWTVSIKIHQGGSWGREIIISLWTMYFGFNTFVYNYLSFLRHWPSLRATVSYSSTPTTAAARSI